jgi:hypothetical protein
MTHPKALACPNVDMFSQINHAGAPTHSGMITSTVPLKPALRIAPTVIPTRLNRKPSPYCFFVHYNTSEWDSDPRGGEQSSLVCGISHPLTRRSAWRILAIAYQTAAVYQRHAHVSRYKLSLNRWLYLECQMSCRQFRE